MRAGISFSHRKRDAVSRETSASSPTWVNPRLAVEESSACWARPWAAEYNLFDLLRPESITHAHGA